MYRYDVDERRRLILATFEHEVSDADLFDYLSHMLSHTRYGAGWASLLEIAPGAEIRLTKAGVQRMRALPLHMEDRLRGARAAIVVRPGSLAEEMARRYATMGSTAYEIAVFPDRESAMRWLLPGESAA